MEAIPVRWVQRNIRLFRVMEVISLVDTATLHEGDRVRIVSEWNSNCCSNRDGLMDKYLGTVMTVHYADAYSACMIEDGGAWAWVDYAIAEVIDDEDIEPATQEEFLAFLMN